MNFLIKRPTPEEIVTFTGDEREDSEIQKMENMLGQNAKLHPLWKREIENYLICPRAIIKFVEHKKLLSGSQKLEQ